MSGQYEETFHLAVPIEKAWQGFTEPGDLESWMGPTAECDVKPGGRMVFGESVEEGLVWEIDEVDEHRLLRYREGPGILPRETKVSVTFERTDTGTRVHITHSGFGDGTDWLGTLEGYRLGWANSLADLELYLRTGVRAMRMFTFKSDLGVALRESLSGPEVLAVTPGSFADKAGLKAGDIIIGLGGVAVFVLTDTWMFTRTHAAGENADVTFVRGREQHTATAPLDAAMSV